MNLISNNGACNVPLSNSFLLIVDPCGLGIELKSFKGVCDGRAAYFYWTTISETDNDYFTLEKSRDGSIFVECERLDGNGTTTEVYNYVSKSTLTDSDFHYYRLKQTDFNGDFSYSEVEYINCQNPVISGISVFPNPTSDFLNISISENHAGEIAVSIVDVTGKSIKDFTFNIEANEIITIPVNYLENGNYFLNIKNVTLDKSYPISKFVVIK